MFSSYAKKRFLLSCVRVLYNLKVDASSHNIATSHAIYRKHVNGQYQCLFQASLGGKIPPPKKLTTPLNVNLQPPPLNDIRSTQPCIPPGSLNRVPALAGLKAGMSPLPGGR